MTPSRHRDESSLLAMNSQGLRFRGPVEVENQLLGMHHGQHYACPCDPPSCAAMNALIDRPRDGVIAPFTQPLEARRHADPASWRRLTSKSHLGAQPCGSDPDHTPICHEPMGPTLHRRTPGKATDLRGRLRRQVVPSERPRSRILVEAVPRPGRHHPNRAQCPVAPGASSRRGRPSRVSLIQSSRHYLRTARQHEPSNTVHS